MIEPDGLDPATYSALRRLEMDFNRALDAITEQLDDRPLRSELSDLRSEVMEQVRTPFDQE